MKSLFFAFTFMLFGVFSSTNANNTIIPNSLEVESTENVSTIDFGDNISLSEQSFNLVANDEYQCYRLYINGQFVGYVCGNSLGEVIDKVLTLLE